MSDDYDAQFGTGNPQVAEESYAYSEALRRFLDRSAARMPDAALTTDLIRDIDRWAARLERWAGPEDDSLWRKARRDQPPPLLPALDFVGDRDQLEGHVTFGRFHIGRGAAHGGAISLVFDEVMGALAASGYRAPSRTAYLHVDYRALTPIDKELRIRAWFDAEEGRKRFIRAAIADGAIICAEAHGLWVELKS